MSESQDQPQSEPVSRVPESVESVSAADETQPASPSKPKTKPKQSGDAAKGLAVVAVLLALVAVALASYVAYQQQQNRQQSEAFQSTMQENLVVLDQRIDVQTLKQALIDESEAIDTRLILLEQQLRGSQQALLDLQDLMGRNDQGWLFAEAEYLLRIAIQRLDLMRDRDGSVAALLTADRRLAQLNDPALTDVRREFAKTIRALRDVSMVDRVGLALQLDEIIRTLEPMALSPALSQAEVLEAPTSEEERGWAQFPRALWEKVSSFVTVRRHDQAIGTLPDAQTEQHIYQMLRLRLEAARLAVMREDDERYHLELKAAQRWLAEYFHPDETTPLLQELATLDEQQLRSDMPDIHYLLDVLNSAKTLKAESVEATAP